MLRQLTTATRKLVRKVWPAELVRERRGNVLMIFAFSILPITFATGMGIDYGAAMRLQTKLRAAADAAALAATSQQMMDETTATAETAARNLFNLQTSGSPGLTIDYSDKSQFNVTVSDTSGATNTRTALVTFRGLSTNIFASILGVDTLTIKGTSTATASTAPNIDFYVLLDSSGSMNLPSTTAGLTQLTGITGGCAFACHSTNDAKARDKKGNNTDYYGVATSYGIPLRFDEAKKAIQSMMTVAQSTENANGAQYRASVASFAAIDTRATNSYKTLSALTTDLSSVSTKAGTAQTSLYDHNNCPTASFCNTDTDTATSDAFTRINSAMPAPGDGKRISGHAPQAVLFIITDGMRDEYRSSGRPEVAIDTALCDTIKNRGIRIAVLYTEYLPASLSDSWSQSNVQPYLYQVEPALQACASSGLYYKVTTDDDISAALNSLFAKAVATSHLIK